MDRRLFLATLTGGMAIAAVGATSAAAETQPPRTAGLDAVRDALTTAPTGTGEALEMRHRHGHRHGHRHRHGRRHRHGMRRHCHINRRGVRVCH